MERLAAWVLLHAIALVTNLVWLQTISAQTISLAGVKPSLWMVLAPALGGLVIGLMARFGSEKIRGHGIPEAIEAILIGGSRMQPKVAMLKPLSSAISIGTGGPFGAEGPIIMTGGALGSLFAQCFHLSAAERKTLLVAGAAAGMTAIFGTPVAAVLLAVELLLFEWKPRSFIPVDRGLRRRPSPGGRCCSATARCFPSPAISICRGGGCSPVSASASSPACSRAFSPACSTRRRICSATLPIHWMWWPAIGGLVVGVGGLIEPRALGVGYDMIGDLLSSHVGVPRSER